MRNRIRKILKENFDEFSNWFNETEPTFKNWDFSFDGEHEYWVDLTKMTKDEIDIVADYILECLPNISERRKITLKNFGNYYGIVLHCGSDSNDYYPTEDNVCFMEKSFEDDEDKNNSIYVDGREVYEYIKIKEEQNLKESLNWSDKDTAWDKDPNWGTDNYYGPDTNNWTTDTAKSQWVQGDGGSSSKSSEDTMSEEDELESDEDWSWLKDTGEHPSYNGHPQGVVYLRDHDEIDEFCDIIQNYNGGELPRGGARENLHRGLEDTRDELEGSDYDPSDAVLSASFFVERKIPGILSVGYWGHNVEHYDITEWLEYEETFNKEYHLYTNLNQVREIFKDYQNPELIKESDKDWDWIDDIKPINDGWDLYHNKLIGDTFTISLKPEVMSDSCVYEYFPYGADYETEIKVMLVEVEPEITVVTNGCNTKTTEVLLLKFDEDTDGHDGTRDHFSGEKNGEIANICDDRCWWVYPGLINVNY